MDTPHGPTRDGRSQGVQPGRVDTPGCVDLGMWTNGPWVCSRPRDNKVNDCGRDLPRA